MESTHIPGNEPDPGDVSTEPSATPSAPPVGHDLPEEQADKLGDLA